MRVFRDISSIAIDSRSIVTVGSFDGVHRGHRVLLNRAFELSRQHNAQMVVVTFGKHPKIDEELTVECEKLMLLEQMGVDAVVLLSFEEVCAIEAETFVQRVLVDALKASTVVVGYDHRFGRDRRGDANLLRRVGEMFDFEVVEVAEQFADGDEVNSTLIRCAVAGGDMCLANRLLGYSYLLVGRCANGVVVPATHKMLPPKGEYRVEVQIADSVRMLDASVGESGICVVGCDASMEECDVIVRFNS